MRHLIAYAIVIAAALVGVTIADDVGASGDYVYLVVFAVGVIPVLVLSFLTADSAPAGRRSRRR